jgi:hypothetical protein
VYIGSDDNKLYALDNVTGTKKWEFIAEGTVACAAVAADGTLYVGSRDGNLYALDGSTGEKKWVFATDDMITTSPAIGPDGTVYIGSQDGRLYAVYGSAPLAPSSWPMFGHDPQHSGRISSLPASLKFVRVALSARGFELRWEGSGVLEYADTTAGPWRDIPAGAGTLYQTAPEGTQRFYRLRAASVP